MQTGITASDTCRVPNGHFVDAMDAQAIFIFNEGYVAASKLEGFTGAT